MKTFYIYYTRISLIASDKFSHEQSMHMWISCTFYTAGETSSVTYYRNYHTHLNP